MKRNHIYGLIVTAAMAMAAPACSDDLGNYTYTPVNEVDVAYGDELVRGETYTYMAHSDYMRFSPKLESSLGITDDASYDFEWRIIPNDALSEDIDPEEVVVCREREINYLVALRPGKYNCYFSAKDKSTSVTWTVPFKIIVTSATNEGWLVLCDVGDKTRLDIIFNRTETEDMLFRDMLADFDFDTGKPLGLFYNYSTYRRPTLLVTDKDTYCLDSDDLHAGDDNRLAWDFGLTPDKLKIKASAISHLAKKKVWAVIDDNDELYTLTLVTDDGTIESGAVFLYPMTKIEGKEQFKPAPFIGIHPKWAMGGRFEVNPFLLYDETNSQFLVLTNNSVYPEVMTFENNNLFENPTGGRTMVWMEPVSQLNRVSSVLRDPATNEMFYYGIGFYTKEVTEGSKKTTINYQCQEGYCQIIGPGVERAEHFAFHHMWNYLFYSVGSKVYKFDLTNPSVPAVQVLDFPGEEITELKFNPFYYPSYKRWQRNREYDLVIGSNVQGKDDSECGIVRFYNIPELYTGAITLKKEFDGFGRIVEIVYEEPAK